MLTQQDLDDLEQKVRVCRLERLRELSAPLATPTLYLDLDSNLQIICSCSAEADLIMSESELNRLIWQVLGIAHFSIWQNEQLVWAGATARAIDDIKLQQLPANELESIVIGVLESDTMTAAILDKPAVVEQNGAAQPAADKLYTVEQIAENLATITKLPNETLIQMILGSRPLMVYQAGQFKIAPSAGAIAFRQWAATIEQRLESGELLQFDAPQEAAPAVPAAPEAENKPAAKRGRPAKTSAKKPAAKAKKPTAKTTVKKSAAKAKTQPEDQAEG